MKQEELLSLLSNVNINSESAEAIAREYFRFQYVEMGVTVTVLVALCFVVAYVAKKLIEASER